MDSDTANLNSTASVLSKLSYSASSKVNRALPAVPHKIVQHVASASAEESRTSSETVVRIYSMYETGDSASASAVTLATNVSGNTGTPRRSLMRLSEESEEVRSMKPLAPVPQELPEEPPAPSISSQTWSKSPYDATPPQELGSSNHLMTNGRRISFATDPVQPDGRRSRSISSDGHALAYMDDTRHSIVNTQPPTSSQPVSRINHSEGDVVGRSSYLYSPQPSSTGHTTFDSATSSSSPARVLSPPPPSPPGKSPDRHYYSTTSHERLGESSTLPAQPRLSSPAPSPGPSRNTSAVRLHSPDVGATTTSNHDRDTSLTSNEPGDGEDAESFHVRNTYAMLSRSGVHGDGYEDGVELTRARLNIDSSVAEASANVRHSHLTINGLQTGVSTKESSLLQSLDRYGFYFVPSHERLLLLPSANLRKHLTIDISVSTNSSASPAYLTSTPKTPPPVKETRRIAKWGRMLEPRSRDNGGNVVSWNVKASKEGKLRERVYKGIPDVWRRAAWGLLAQRYSRASDMDLETWKKEYTSAVDQPSKYDIQIDLDVPRTISGHVMFRTRYGQGQRSLFHVLHSFSLRCSECGYVQGMGPIAATFLNYYEPESTYATFVQLHDAYQLHAIFMPGFPGLLEQIYVQERIMRTMMPGVYAAFQKHSIGTTSYATKWYITLFSNTMPFQTQLRLWDVFLLDGPDVFVMVATAIVWVFRENILAVSATFESVLSLLSSSFTPEDEDLLLKWIDHALSDKKLRQNMASWREEWHGLVARGEDRDALL